MSNIQDVQKLRWQPSPKKQYEGRVEPQLWEEHRDAIIGHYKTHSLKLTRDWMQETLKFTVSTAQLRKQLRDKWDIGKYRSRGRTKSNLSAPSKSRIEDEPIITNTVHSHNSTQKLARGAPLDESSSTVNPPRSTLSRGVNECKEAPQRRKMYVPALIDVDSSIAALSNEETGSSSVNTEAFQPCAATGPRVHSESRSASDDWEGFTSSAQSVIRVTHYTPYPTALPNVPLSTLTKRRRLLHSWDPVGRASLDITSFGSLQAGKDAGAQYNCPDDFALDPQAAAFYPSSPGRVQSDPNSSASARITPQSLQCASQNGFACDFEASTLHYNSSMHSSPGPSFLNRDAAYTNEALRSPWTSTALSSSLADVCAEDVDGSLPQRALQSIHGISESLQETNSRSYNEFVKCSRRSAMSRSTPSGASVVLGSMAMNSPCALQQYSYIPPQLASQIFVQQELSAEGRPPQSRATDPLMWTSLLYGEQFRGSKKLVSPWESDHELEDAMEKLHIDSR